MLRQHIITRHHHHTKPIHPKRDEDSGIRSAAERWGRGTAYDSAVVERHPNSRHFAACQIALQMV
jgi:hypothetical protein